MTDNNQNDFLGLGEDSTNYADARVVILPVPYESTVSYGKGTSKAPQAIIDASAYVETYDRETNAEPFDVGISTSAPLPVEGAAPAELAHKLEEAVSVILNDGKYPLILGGEHSITPPSVKAVRAKYDDLTVVQLDAHADLRDEYEGERLSHACAMARSREICPAVQVGIRSYSKEESELISVEKLPVFCAADIHRDPDWINEAIAAIDSENVFITLDVDVFDGSILPATGTPEPGGLDWRQVTSFLAMLFSKKRVVGLDIVELAPIDRFHAYDFMIAKLAYKCIAYWRAQLLKK
jgi:N1-aminopropylagmatine ureohydrolase